METPEGNAGITESTEDSVEASQEHKSLKYSLLGPSLLKAGQDAVDQRKVGHFHPSRKIDTID
jgi:DNA polymerase kappa